jgi:hypothetical protein
MHAIAPQEILAHQIEADSFEELADIAVERLRAQGPSDIVCGPITTGGTNHEVHNLEIFHATVRYFLDEGERLFNQMPYEFGLHRLANAWHDAGNPGYCTPTLTVFYSRIFATRLITRAWFIPGWDKSFGARFKRRKLVLQRATIVDLTQEDIRGFMLAEHASEHVEKVLSLMQP